MRPWLRLLSALVLTLSPLASGCQGGGERRDAPSDEVLGEGAPEAAMHDMQSARSLAGARSQKAAPAGSAEALQAPDSSSNGSAPDASAGMYIIRKGSVTVQVPDVRAGVRKVTQLARDAGGFVADSSYQAAEGDTPSATLTLRVPSKRFDALLDAIGGVGNVFARTIGSEDVTLSYVDTQSRIKNLRKEEDLLRKMLDRTGKLTDVLAVERELSRVSGEIEQAQGRLRHLANMVELATIEVTLSEKVKIVSTSPWGMLPAAVENAIADAQRSLASSAAGALQAAIWFGMVILPTLVLLGGAFVLLGWLLRRWVVGRALVPAAWYDRAWGAAGVALLVAWQPGLMGALVTAALALVALAAGTKLFEWLKGRRVEGD